MFWNKKKVGKVELSRAQVQVRIEALKAQMAIYGACAADRDLLKRLEQRLARAK